MAKKKDNSNESNKSKVLTDHKQVGKVLLAPMNHMLPGKMTAISSRDVILPEMFWLYILDSKMGFEKTTTFLSELAKIFKALFPKVTNPEISDEDQDKVPEEKDFKVNPSLCFSTTYGLLNADQLEYVKNQLTLLPETNDVKSCLSSYLHLFPECSLNLVFSKEDAVVDTEFVDWMDNELSDLLDRHNYKSIRMLALGIGALIIQGKVNVPEHVGAHFDDIFSGPENGHAPRIASFCRAFSMALAGQELNREDSRTWSKYFWNRCLDLKPIDFSYLLSEDSHEL